MNLAENRSTRSHAHGRRHWSEANALRTVVTSSSTPRLEAAQRASACEAKGDREAAANWRRIQSALTTMQSPHVS